ncbi:MAG: carboxylesterase [Blastocatellia bacterium]|nr:MAG: carboxylesterase [Blastocatellia bacterium]
MKLTFVVLTILILFAGSHAQTKVKTTNGVVEGMVDTATGVRSFKGIPYATPPVGNLRWQPPQPAENWKAVRKADQFGPRCMQRPIFSDMVFRSNGMSEDCLYLNVWTPAKSGAAKLPVLVYFYGGGFASGDGSEPRYEGASMAQKGVVALTVNYRLAVFGFFSHPELTKESPHHASGNYGLLDQTAALRWVQQNIAAFGGDPKRVTIAGESAGSVSVSAQMASPLSKDLIARAIGESGSLLGTLAAMPLEEAEKNGVTFATSLGVNSLAELRAKSAQEILDATAKPGTPWPTPTVDGYLFPKSPFEIYAAGEQAHVPLMVGSNSEENPYVVILGRDAPTVENYRKALQKLYADKADQIFNLYPASNEEEVKGAAQDLASDRFISYSTWKWIDLATKTGSKPSYYYLYSRPRPALRTPSPTPMPPPRGAAHSAEIEYAMGNLDSNKVYAWTPDDYKISKVLQSYFVNFIKTGNPNGPGMPSWPQFGEGKRMVIDVQTRAEPEKVRQRYQFLDQFYAQR